MKNLNQNFDKVFFLMFSGFMLSFSVFIVFLWTFLTAIIFIPIIIYLGIKLTKQEVKNA